MKHGTSKLLLPLALLLACEDRPEVFDAALSSSPKTFALSSSVVVVDDPAHRAVVLTPRAGLELDRTSVPIGTRIVNTARAADGKRAFLLSAGDQPRTKDKNERPGLTIIEGKGARRIDIDSPHTGVVADPLGRYVAIFADAALAGAATFLENPNELVILDLEASGGPSVTYRTIRSFGGKPQRVSFSPVLALPGGQRRLLVVETEQDVTLLDLDHLRDTPERPEVTVRLTSGTSTKPARPAAVVFDDGDPTRADDARVGVRLAGDSNVVVLTLSKSEAGAPNDFRPTVNLADVGGAPTDIAFVRTEAGLRLVAVVPTTRSAALVEPDAGTVAKVELPASYSNLSLISNVAGGTSEGDVVLLYAGNTDSVAFWALGRAIGQPYRSLEIVPLPGAAVKRAIDVPAPHASLKILEGGTSFYVLDLVGRTASPLVALAEPKIHISSDGNRLWAFRPNGADLAAVTLNDLKPIALPLDHPISEVFEVAREGGGRALVTIDMRGGLGATVLDAEVPDTVLSRTYAGLLLEGLK